MSPVTALRQWPAQSGNPSKGRKPDPAEDLRIVRQLLLAHWCAVTLEDEADDVDDCLVVRVLGASCGMVSASTKENSDSVRPIHLLRNATPRSGGAPSSFPLRSSRWQAVHASA
ncbi:MAG: hypothetical protein ACRD2N_20375 [Vicinamibacterales bacterium]